MGSCLSWSISLFFPKQLHPALILAYISSLVVSLRCVYFRYRSAETIATMRQKLQSNLLKMFGFF